MPWLSAREDQRLRASRMSLGVVASQSRYTW
jgi:hypothetical protein